MNRVIVRKSIVGITLALLLLNLSISSYSQDSSQGSYRLNHSVTVTEHGFLAVEEIVDFVNTEPSVVTLQQFDITYATISIDSISSITTQGPIDFSVKKSSIDNDTIITIIPIGDYRVDSGDNITIGLQFFVSDQVNVTSATNYSANLPLVPSMNRVIDEVKINVYLPTGSGISSMPTGFFLVDDVFVKIVGSFENIRSNDANTQVIEYSLDTYNNFGILEFPSVDRTFIPSPDGSVVVRDEIRVVNRGELKANNIRLLRLDNDGINIDVVPIGNPPLINRFSVTLVDEVFDLQSIYRTSLSQGEEILFVIEYPISLGYSESVDGAMSFDLPVKPPIEGIVERFTIKVEPMSGVSISGGESRIILGATSYTKEMYHFSIGPQIAWATDTILPVATLLFIISIVTIIATKVQFRRSADVKKEIPRIEELIILFEEKTVAIENIIQSYRNKKRGSISRGNFAETKRYFESLKGKSAGKTGEIRSKITIQEPHIKNNLEELSNSDKDYNRAVLDIIKLYEQYHTGKIREDTFVKLRRMHQKRFDKAKDRLLGKVENIHSGLER
tara:strand:+ start:385 stop:2064 length:1680 start_codon:yes stop_codon:yes gene_type:complete